MKSPITTHILDTSLGRPAAGVRVVLDRLGGEGGQEVGTGTTDADGRVMDFFFSALEVGVYRLTFHVGEYAKSTGRPTFYPEVPVVFEVLATDQHYHVPLLLNPFGYATYRGS